MDSDTHEDSAVNATPRNWPEIIITMRDEA
jgi:hypothetical protein